MTKCEHHNFQADVEVNRLPDTGRFNADVKIKCTDCGTPFRFIGLPIGIDLNGAAVSADGAEARLAIAPQNEVYNILDDACTGYTIRKQEIDK